MTTLTKKGNQYYYGENKKYRVLDSLGGLTTTF